jgi:uncharacterized protein (DUF4415 family)
MVDEEIDYSDIPTLPEGFFDRAVLRIPAAQAASLIRLDPDVLEWFRSQAGDYREAIRDVLRRYMESAGR